MRVVTPNAETIDLGITETDPTVGIIDYGRRTTDDFGVTTVVERGFARRMSLRFQLPTAAVDNVQRRLAKLRATAATWIADDRYAWLSAPGYFKDFQVTLATDQVSYCELTVEGLASSETVVDAGADPAPNGSASTLQLLDPVDITDGTLASSSVAETDEPEWSATATYALGARVMKAATHRVYESAAAANKGSDPAGASGKWIDLAPTGRWAMFDRAIGTKTIATGQIVVTLTATSAINGLAIVDTDAGSIRVQAAGYDRTQLRGGIYGDPGAVLFLDLTVPVGGTITVTVNAGGGGAAAPRTWNDAAAWVDAQTWLDGDVAGGTGPVSVGTLLIGTVRSLGITEASPTAGIIDFSRKETDDFGETTVVERAWTKRMSANALIRTDALDQVANRLAAVRARPALWIGQAGLDSLTIYGFFKDFSISVGPSVSTLALSVEGLSTAIKPQPLQTSTNWPDVGDPDGTKPANNATNSADPTSPFGGGTVAGTITKVDAASAAAAAAKLRTDTLDGITIPAINTRIVDANLAILAAQQTAADAVAGANAKIIAAQTVLDQAVSNLADEITRAKGKEESLDQRIDTVSASGGYDDTAIKASIQTVNTARADGDRALAGRIDTLQSSYTAGGNMLANTEFTTGADGWTFVSESGSVGAWDGLTGPSYWPLGMHVLVNVQDNTGAGRAGYWHQNVFGLEPGSTYQATAYAGSHRCSTYIQVNVVTPDSEVVLTTYSVPIDQGNDATGKLSDFRRMVATFTVPANATRCVMYLMKGGTETGTNSVAWYTRPQLVKVQAGVTAAVPYTPGSNAAEQVATNAKIDQRVTTLTNADTALGNRIDTVTTDYKARDVATNARVDSQATALTDAKQSIAFRIDGVVTDYQGKDSATNTRITSQVAALSDADRSLGERIDSLVVSGGGYNDSSVRAEIGRVDTAAISRDSALTGRIDTLQSSYTSGGNMLANTEFATGADGWTYVSESSAAGAWDGLTGPAYWPLGLHALVNVQDNAAPDRSGYWYQLVYGLEPGATYQATAWGASHRCATYIQVNTLTPTSDIASVSYSPPIDQGNDATGKLSDYRRMMVTFTVPANATRCVMYLMKGGTETGTNSVGWYIRPQLVKVRPGVTTAVPYTPGSNAAEQVATNAKIDQRVTTLTNADTALGARIDTVTTDYKARDTATNTRITTNVTALTNADMALGTRIDAAVTDYQGKDSATNGRITAQYTTLSNADAAIGQRIDNVITEYRGLNTTTNARITTEINAVSSATQAVANRAATLEATAGTLNAKVTTAEGAIVDLKGRTSAYWRTTAVAGNNRAQVTVSADANAGAGVDIVGDVSISGNLTVDGTITSTKFDSVTMAREASGSWSGSVQGRPGGASVPFSLTLVPIQPRGRFLIEKWIQVSTNAGQRDTTYNYNGTGLNLYTHYEADGGGLFLRSYDDQGHVYRVSPDGIFESQPVLATTAFGTTFVATVYAGGNDTGVINQGDYFERYVSASYTLTQIVLKVTWLAI